MRFRSLPVKNLLRRPRRTVALMCLTALLALSVFGGSVVVLSLRRGLNSLESRLGADIIVVPAEAQSKVSFQNMFLQGTTGAYYMKASVLDKVLAKEGVEKAAAQTFLTTMKADCCSVKIQIIGIDPETDFTVMPWIRESSARKLGDMELAVGCKVESGVGDTLRIYDLPCAVTAKLAPTGTGLDTAVYCSMDTMKRLILAAEQKGVTAHKVNTDNSDDVISAVYVKVKEGYDIDRVKTSLVGIRKATPVRTRSMLTEVSDSLYGISRTVTVLIGAVWVLSFVILLIAFAMIVNERRREFAVLRLLGTSRGMLGGMVLKETALCSLLGGLLGVGLAALMVFPFTRLIERSLSLPYLTPGIGTILLLAACAVGMTVLIGALAGAFAARRLSRVDPGSVLREGS